MKLKVTIKGGSQLARAVAHAKIADALSGYYAEGTALNANDTKTGRKLTAKAKLDRTALDPDGKVG